MKNKGLSHYLIKGFDRAGKAFTLTTISEFHALRVDLSIGTVHQVFTNGSRKKIKTVIS